MGLRKFLTPKWVDKLADIYRQEGFRGVFKKSGLLLLLGFIIFYLIRDSILYLLIPYLIAKGVIDVF